MDKPKPPPSRVIMDYDFKKIKELEEELKKINDGGKPILPLEDSSFQIIKI